MLLANKEQDLHENAKISFICKEKFEDKCIKDKKHCKVRDHCHYTREHSAAVHFIHDIGLKKFLNFS